MVANKNVFFKVSPLWQMSAGPAWFGYSLQSALRSPKVFRRCIHRLQSKAGSEIVSGIPRTFRGHKKPAITATSLKIDLMDTASERTDSPPVAEHPSLLELPKPESTASSVPLSFRELTRLICRKHFPQRSDFARAT